MVAVHHNQAQFSLEGLFGNLLNITHINYTFLFLLNTAFLIYIYKLQIIFENLMFSQFIISPRCQINLDLVIFLLNYTHIVFQNLRFNFFENCVRKLVPIKPHGLFISTILTFLYYRRLKLFKSNFCTTFSFLFRCCALKSWLISYNNNIYFYQFFTFIAIHDLVDITLNKSPQLC